MARERGDYRPVFSSDAPKRHAIDFRVVCANEDNRLLELRHPSNFCVYFVEPLRSQWGSPLDAAYGSLTTTTNLGIEVSDDLRTMDQVWALVRDMGTMTPRKILCQWKIDWRELEAIPPGYPMQECGANSCQNIETSLSAHYCQDHMEAVLEAAPHLAHMMHIPGDDRAMLDLLVHDYCGLPWRREVDNEVFYATGWWPPRCNGAEAFQIWPDETCAMPHKFGMAE